MRSDASRRTGRIAAIAVWLATAALAQTPAVRTKAAAIAVGGDVRETLSLTAEELARMPRQTLALPNPDGTKTVYEGVPLRDVLKRAGAPIGNLRGKMLSSYVIVKARDGYAVAFSLGELDPEFGDETILVVDRLDGKPLPDDQGPFRLVCPHDKAGARSVRMVEAIELVRVVK